MRSFWIALSVLTLLAATVFLFFVFSIRVKDHIKFTDNTITTPTVTVADPQIGAKDPKITIVNYGDYQCPSCADLENTLTTLLDEFPAALKVVWKDMPNTSVHDEALNAAIAAQCAGEQKRFWEYHRLLMENSIQLGSDLYTALAQNLNLRENAFARCLENQSTLPLVQRGFDEGAALNITATPTIYLNGERYTGSLSTGELRHTIQAELANL